MAADVDDARLTEVAARLSIVPPDDFVSERTSAAKEAGDRSLAAAIKKLRKPLLAAWVVNVLAAEDAATLTPAMELAEELRDALETGDAKALSALNTRRRQTLRDLTAAALDRAAQHGVDVSAAARDGVERTLDAALRDPDAAAAVATARLLRPIEATGMEPPDLTDAVSGPYDASTARSEPPSDELAERRARRDAERAAKEARRHAEAAERELSRVEEKWQAAQERVTALEERIAELDRERDRLETEADRLRDEVDDLSAARRTARDEARKARRAADRVSD